MLFLALQLAEIYTFKQTGYAQTKPFIVIRLVYSIFNVLQGAKNSQVLKRQKNIFENFR